MIGYLPRLIRGYWNAWRRDRQMQELTRWYCYWAIAPDGKALKIFWKKR